MVNAINKIFLKQIILLTLSRYLSRMSSLHPVQTTLPWKASDAIFWGKADGEAGSNRPLTSSDELCRNRHIFSNIEQMLLAQHNLKLYLNFALL